MLAWIDLEMTGLDTAQNVIVEIATLLTDDNLEIIAEGPDSSRQGSDRAASQKPPQSKTTSL